MKETAQEEIAALLEAAMYKEVASASLYSEAGKLTVDPGARALLTELAADEERHLERLKALKKSSPGQRQWRLEKVADLRLSDYLTGGESLSGAGIQDSLIFAMKQEEQSMLFYTQMMAALRSYGGKELCQWLVQEELRHKLRLELLYEELFYAED